MGAYLIDNPPARSQYGSRSRLTGATILHTAESVMDSVGPDTGAEAVADFIRRRTTPGSYHDLADSDTYVHLVPYHLAAWQDGTGSNAWALSVSFACRTSDWRAMTPEKRAGFLAQGARAFAAQQAWRRANGKPLTELRRITKAQSDAGASGFCYHGDRDPGRRTDPGTTAPNLFPFDEWIDHCLAAVTGGTLPSEEFTVAQYDDIMAAIAQVRNEAWQQHKDMANYNGTLAQTIRGILVGGNQDGRSNFHWLADQIATAVASIPGAQVEADRRDSDPATGAVT